MPANSFLYPLGTVSFDTYDPADTADALASTEALAWQRLDQMLALPAGLRTFENTVLAYAEAADEFDFIKKVAEHMAAVLSGPWHAAIELATERESELHNKLRFHQGIYRALVEVRDRPGYMEGQSKARRKYLDELILVYERDGITLPPDKQEALKEVSSQLSAAMVTFTKNLVEACDRAGIAAAEAGQLAGLSDEFVQNCRRAAQDKGQEGYWVAYNQPNYAYVMSTCTNRATRQDLYRAHVSLATDSNVTGAHHILGLRQRLAGLLGYRDYADYALQLRMAKNGQTAADFIGRLTDIYRPTALAEHEQLTAFARDYERDQDLELDASDIATGLDFFYANRLKSTLVGVDDEELRDYFTLGHVKDVMFSTLSALYGLEFKAVTVPAWAGDVEVYEIHDQGRHLSTVWCDWYARKGKNGGAWADVLYVADRAGGVVTRPSLGCVVCNFPPPDGSGHSRLSVRDVETLWHEFGHFVHLTCSMTELRQLCSFSCRWDFVEAPSQIMENWVWQKEVMTRMGAHHQTGALLSDEVVAKLLEARRFRVATKAMRQFNLASQDLGFHRDYTGADGAALVAYYQDLYRHFWPVGPYPEDTSFSAFSHIFGGEYAASYYSYKWAEAIEADLFSVFMPDGLTSRERGMRYRKEVLARGAEEEPDVLVADFLGRSSTPEAMLARDGIVAR